MDKPIMGGSSMPYWPGDVFDSVYRRYWTRDINTLNSNFGTPEDLKNLSTALHTRGMYLMVDVIVNQ